MSLRGERHENKVFAWCHINLFLLLGRVSGWLGMKRKSLQKAEAFWGRCSVQNLCLSGGKVNLEELSQWVAFKSIKKFFPDSTTFFSYFLQFVFTFCLALFKLIFLSHYGWVLLLALPLPSLEIMSGLLNASLFSSIKIRNNNTSCSGEMKLVNMQNTLQLSVRAQ